MSERADHPTIHLMGDDPFMRVSSLDTYHVETLKWVIPMIIVLSVGLMCWGDPRPLHAVAGGWQTSRAYFAGDVRRKAPRPTKRT